MLQTIALDTKTMLIRADVESDFSALFDFLNRKEKQNKVNALLQFANAHYKTEAGFKFNREACYDR